MGTPVAVIYGNLTVACIESKMFERLPELYPTDVVNLFVSNYFRFLDDVFFKWREGFDVSLLYELFENIDPHIKYIFEKLSTEQHSLDVKSSIEGKQINVNIHYKPTNPFAYLRFDSCHPHKDIRIEKLKVDLINRGHPIIMVEESLCKIYSPKNQTNKKDKELIMFIHTYNPNHDFNLRKVTNCMGEIQDKKLK